MSDSVWPQRRQPTRLPRPWDSPGKNTGVGCHFLLQCMKVKSESEVAQSGPTLSDPMDFSLPGSSIHGIFQATVLEWGATAFSRYLWVIHNYIPHEQFSHKAYKFYFPKYVLRSDLLLLSPFLSTIWPKAFLKLLVNFYNNFLTGLILLCSPHFKLVLTQQPEWSYENLSPNQATILLKSLSLLQNSLK